jgi:hypothetical protein
VFGNMGTIVSFRIGQNDVESLGKYFQPTFDGDDLLRVPNYNTIVRTLIGGVPTQPFSMATLPPLGTPNPRLYDALKQLSAAKYGLPKAQVEKEVFERFKTKADAAAALAPAPGVPSPSPFAASPAPAAQAPAPTPAGSGSFLDEWLSKRRNGTPPPTVGSTMAPPPPAPVAVTRTVEPTPAPAFEPAPHIRPAISSHGTAPTSGRDETTDPEFASLEPSETETTVHMPKPKPAPASSQTDTEPSQGTHNISSDTIVQNEVTKIADQLRQRLDTSKDTTNAAAADAQKDKDDELLQLPTLPITSSVPKTNQPNTKDDTIFIDADGVFRQSDTSA